MQDQHNDNHDHNQSDLDDFHQKLLKARGEDKQSAEKKEQEKVELESRQGIQAGVELVGAIFIPTAIGYMIDGYFDTRPLFMLILFFLGICTGFYNVYRISQNIGTAVGAKKQDKDKETQ